MDEKKNHNKPVVVDTPKKETLSTISTSKVSAKLVEPIVLSEGSRSRKVVLAEIYENPHNPNAGVRISICYQKKGIKDKWENADVIDLKSLKAGEGVRITLSSEESLKLTEALEKLHALKADGIKRGRRDFAVIAVDEERAALIGQLVESGHSLEVWQLIVKESPALATKLSTARLVEHRRQVLAEFEVAIDDNSKDEKFWQDFFERHKWIFGYGLRYQILRNITSQPYHGGKDYSGTSGQFGDFLERTAGDIGFTVLVEIKAPRTSLVGSRQYRNGVWELGGDLVGGVSQLQSCCRVWDQRGAREPRNEEKLREANVHTIQPKGILVIGRLSQLTGAQSYDKRETFELFRRNLQNPEVITFDELLARARYIVDHSEKEAVAEMSEAMANEK